MTKKTIKRTVPGGTLTTKGFIHDLEHPAGEFFMPIKLKTAPNSISGNPRPPEIKGGFFIFALPGGGSYQSFIQPPENKR